jgi:sporulation protein YlmC with PRC-barrel domain
MAGIVKEGEEVIKESVNPDTKNAGLISAAQRAEHYEIAAYGTARTHARQLGYTSMVKVLRDTLEEEKETDRQLTSLAENSINVKAAMEKGKYGSWKQHPNEPIPEDELAIRRGAQVEATDGHVGRVDEFLINPDNDLITHLVLREGHLWGKKDVVIPVSQIDRFEDNTVHLKLDKSEIEALPTIPINRLSDKKIKA